MLLQFCDKCGRPLSEGCIARGEAVERNGETICSHCLADESAVANVQRAKETAQETTGPLGHYEHAVWHCNSCGIPVTALDLIEGRATRDGETLKCSRCAQGNKPAPEAPPKRPPGVSAPRPRTNYPTVKPPRPSSRAAETFMAAAQSEQRRPVLPIVLFVIVLAGFAASMYFAINSQRKLDEAMARQNSMANARPAPVDNRPPREPLDPRPVPPSNNTSYTPPGNDGGETINEPRRPETLPRIPLPEAAADALVGIEKDLAERVNQQLDSGVRAMVLEGLIEAGSRRLIGSRPHVRALLKSQDDLVRAIACRVAAMLNDNEALPTLNRMIEQDPVTSVQIEARKARDRLTGKATREISELNDDELAKMLRELKKELERREGGND